jgi:RNA polymerase sigma factor (TIGR02999 family)
VDLTKLLRLAKNGDNEARADVIRVAYEDLRRVAEAHMRDQRENHTLTSTALVHEVAVHILEKGNVKSENRAQFLAYASTAMRRILVDHSRARGAQKRKGNRRKLELDEAFLAAAEQRDDFLRLNDALDGLVEMDPRSGQIVEMRYFGGMSLSEVAAALDVSLSTVKRDWENAKAWLLCEISQEDTT